MELKMTYQKKPFIDAAQIVTREYAKRTCELEIDLAMLKRPPHEDECVNQVRAWGRSTPNRRCFMMCCTIAALDDTYMPVATIRKRLNISRATIDTMINECEEAGWITVKRDKRGYRSLRATDCAVESMLTYLEFLHNLVKQYDINNFSVAYTQLRCLAHTD